MALRRRIEGEAIKVSARYEDMLQFIVYLPLRLPSTLKDMLRNSFLNNDRRYWINHSGLFFVCACSHCVTFSLHLIFWLFCLCFFGDGDHQNLLAIRQMFRLFLSPAISSSKKLNSLSNFYDFFILLFLNFDVRLARSQNLTSTRWDLARLIFLPSFVKFLQIKNEFSTIG